MERVAIQLSCYNGARYLPYVLASLKAQTFQGWKLYVTDNASRPEEKAAVQAFAKELDDQAEYFDVGEKNVDFVGAHNLLFKRHEAPFVMLHNDDAILAPDYVEKLVAALETDKKLAAVSGRVLRWDFARAAEAGQGKTDAMDSLGLAKARTWAVSDRTESPVSEGAESVFGVSGCLPMYRRAAALAVSPDGNLFDPAYVSYKEDVDLAFRLNEGGWRAATVHDTKAWHRRTLKAESRADQPERPLLHSYRNHLWNLKVHLGWGDLLRDGWAVVPYELAKAAYWLGRRPSIALKAWAQTLARRAAVAEKRRFCRALSHQSLSSHPVSASRYDVAVVIVCHNDLNAECLASVDRARKAANLKTAVVVVDNDSTAFDAPKVLWDVIPDGIVVQRNWDAGYGSSMNRGAKEADADYVFILNPDTVLTDELILAKLVAFLKAHPQAGIAAPKVLYPDGKLQETVRRFPGWQVPFLQRTKLGQTAYGKKYLNRFLMRDVPHDETRMVDWAQGSALFLPMDHWKALGGFDDRFWMYFEDVDLCRRSWEANRPVYYVADATMQHAFGKASARQGSLLRTLATNKMARAHFISFLKYMAKWPRDLVRPQPK